MAGLAFMIYSIVMKASTMRLLSYTGEVTLTNAIEYIPVTPEAEATYVKFIEDYIGIPVTIVSVGPDRNATIVRS